MKRCIIYCIKRSQSLSNYQTKSYAYTIYKAYRLALNLNEPGDFFAFRHINRASHNVQYSFSFKCIHSLQKISVSILHHIQISDNRCRFHYMN